MLALSQPDTILAAPGSVPALPDYPVAIANEPDSHYPVTTIVVLSRKLCVHHEDVSLDRHKLKSDSPMSLSL